MDSQCESFAVRVLQQRPDNAWGGVLRIGFDYMVNDMNGIYFSADKVYVDTTATGKAVALGGAPVKAEIDLDPLIVQVGWVRRF